MAGPASDYQRGEMEIEEQVSTYDLIMGYTKWGSLALAVFLTWSVLQFCTETGFLGSMVSALVVLIAGVMVMRKKPAH